MDKIRLQKFKQDVNTCGRWVVDRILHYDTPYRSWANWFQSQGENPDYLVTVKTMNN